MVLDVAQAVRLVPPLRKDIEANLPTDGIFEAIVREAFLQSLYHRFSDVMHLRDGKGARRE